jgi:hypothetical protein
MASIINATTTNGLSTSADNSGSLQLATNNGTTAVTIDTSQNVGIGTSSPLGKLNVSSASFGGTVSSNANQVVAENSGNAGITIASGAASLGNLFFADSGDTADGFVQYDQSGRSMRFGTATAERMRIDSSGNLLVGATGTSANPRTVLYGGSSAGFIDLARTGTSLNDVINFSNGNGVVGTIRTTGSATQYNTNSDYRLKENIAPMTGALDVVLRQRPVTYKWKVDGTDGQGFIAHWLQEDGAGGCVSGEKDAVDEEGNPVYQGIDTSFLVATLTAAIQELKAELDTVKATVEAQAVRIAELEGAK